MGIAHIQQSTGSWGTTQQGSLLVAALMFGTLNGSVGVTSVTDSANTYKLIGTVSYTDATWIGSTGSFTGWQIGLYYVPNAASTSGSLTVTTSGSPTVSATFLHEYSVAAATAPLDTFASAATSQSAVPFTDPTLTITPAGSGELIYLVSDTSSVPSGFSALQSSATLTTNPGSPSFPYTEIFYDSHILSCAGGTTTLTTTARFGIAAAFLVETNFFSPRWISI